MENQTKQCLEYIGDRAYKDIFIDKDYAAYMAIGIPVIAGLGVIGNMFAVWINQYRKLTGISITLLNSLMVIDSGFLLSIMFMYAPRGNLSMKYTVEDCASQNPAFWESIEFAQRMYVIVHPMMDLARILVVWFTAAYTFEQYAALFRQAKMASISQDKSAGIKLIVIIFNLVIIVSLIHFFKFVRRPSLYGPVEHLKVCLSDVYLTSTYSAYDVYVYFGIFVVVPWFLILAAIIRICLEFYQQRHERQKRKQSAGETGVSLVMKEARSRKTVVTITIYFLLCYLAVDVLHAITVNRSRSVRREILCYLVPMDRRFSVLENGLMFEVIFTVFQLMYSSVKLPICYLAGKTFRHIVHLKIEQLNRGILTCCASVARLWSPPMSDMERLTQRMQTTHGQGALASRPYVAVVSYDNTSFVSPEKGQGQGQRGHRDTSRPDQVSYSPGYHGHGLLGGYLSNKATYGHPHIAEARDSIQNKQITRYDGNDVTRSANHKARPYVLHPGKNTPAIWESHV